MADENDFSKASKYIDEFYTIRAAIVDEFGDGARDAISNFVNISSIKDKEVTFDALSLLIDLGLTMLPGTKFLQIGLGKVANLAKGPLKYEIWDKNNKDKLQAVMGKLYELGEEKAKSLIMPSSDGVDSSSAAGFAVNSLDGARKLSVSMKSNVMFERNVMSACLDLMADSQPDKSGKLYQTFANTILGPKPVYDPNEIEAFYKKFELRLYQKFYWETAYIKRSVIFNHFSEQVSETVVGIPDAVAARIMQLTRIPSLFGSVHLWGLRVRHERRSTLQGVPKI